MAKSLKNFITIRQVLKFYTAQQVRVLFLLQSWDGTINYQKENPMGSVNAWLNSLNEFFFKTTKCLYVLKVRRYSELGRTRYSA